MKQHWLVAPVDIKRDERKPMVITRTPNRPQAANVADALAEEINEAPVGRGFAILQDEFRPAPARGRTTARREDTDQWGNPVGTEYGYIMSADTKREVEVAFTNRDLAFEYAADQASKKPGVQYGVFECVGVLETTTPTVIHKKFNTGGELVLEAQE